MFGSKFHDTRKKTEIKNTNFNPISSFTPVVLISLILIVLPSCVTRPINPFQNKSIPPEKTITIMSYNVENLFDTVHDEGKEDYAYLPLREKRKNPEIKNYCLSLNQSHYQQECWEMNWDEDQLRHKMEAITPVVKQVYGVGPDILILIEIENQSVLERWVEEYLSESQYKTVVLKEGPDPRGVDPAVVSRLPLAGEPKLHEIEWNHALSLVEKPTRGILQVPLLLSQTPRKIIHVFAVHFPSQAAPTPLRKDGVETLKKLVTQLPPNDLWIIGGDWNITAEEDEKHQFFKTIFESMGALVSHRVGCQRCRGTHNYRGTWSFLDVLVFSHHFRGPPYQLDPNSITTPMWAPGQIRVSGRPWRYSWEERSGISDHLPIYAEVRILKEEKDSKGYNQNAE